MKKNFFKILFINFLNIIFIFIIFELIFFMKECLFYKNTLSYENLKNNFKNIRQIFYKKSFDDYFNKIVSVELLKPIGKKYKKKPVLLLGCSFAYGQFLDENKKINYQISEKSKRPVYNWAYPGFGIQHVYYTVNRMPKIEPEPEYIFYFFIYDHIRRMLVNCGSMDNFEYLRYEMKNGEFKKKDNRYNFLHNSYLLYGIKNFILKNIDNEIFLDTFMQYTLQLKNKVKEIYPESKFIIVVFDDMPYNMVEEMEKNNVKIFYLKEYTKIDFSDDKYRLSKEEDIFRHPNELAWDIISDALIKEFNL